MARRFWLTHAKAIAIAPHSSQIRFVKEAATNIEDQDPLGQQVAGRSLSWQGEGVEGEPMLHGGVWTCSRSDSEGAWMTSLEQI
jgi:hypothetical protein